MDKNQPGQLTEKIWLLGRRESCIYLVKDQDQAILLGGGMVHIAPDIPGQMKNLSLDPKSINNLVILHSHFDHCAAVPFLKKAWPWIEVGASQRAKELLASEKVIKGIEYMNQVGLEQMGLAHLTKKYDLSFKGIQVERVLQTDDVLHCGDLELQILEVPGHSSCSIAVYIPALQALFPSDAAGIPFGDDVFTAANSNFDLYMENLERMANLEVKFIGAEHYGAKLGEEAKLFLKKSIQSANRTRAILEESLAKTKDLKSSVEEVTNLLYQNVPTDFLPREIISVVIGQMLRYLMKTRQTTTD